MVSAVVRCRCIRKALKRYDSAKSNSSRETLKDLQRQKTINQKPYMSKTQSIIKNFSSTDEIDIAFWLAQSRNRVYNKNFMQIIEYCYYI